VETAELSKIEQMRSVFDFRASALQLFYL